MSLTGLSETAPESPIRVFLVLQNRLLRDALGRLLRKRADLLVVGCSGPEECSQQSLLESQCDVLVLDFFDVSWRPANLRVNAECLSVPKLVLIGMSGDAEQFLAAVRGGVSGYLLKEASLSEVVAAVRATFREEAVCPPKLCVSLFQHVSQMLKESCSPPSEARPDLTFRQRQLVALIAKGLTNKEIASRLNLSEYTVKNHVHRIMKQVDAESRTQAVDTILSYGYSTGWGMSSARSECEAL